MVVAGVVVVEVIAAGVHRSVCGPNNECVHHSALVHAATSACSTKPVYNTRTARPQQPCAPQRLELACTTKP
eukprot:1618757-Pyramimonas_sp.AAC.1